MSKAKSQGLIFDIIPKNHFSDGGFEVDNVKPHSVDIDFGDESFYELPLNSSISNSTPISDDHSYNTVDPNSSLKALFESEKPQTQPPEIMASSFVIANGDKYDDKKTLSSEFEAVLNSDTLNIHDLKTYGAVTHTLKDRYLAKLATSKSGSLKSDFNKPLTTRRRSIEFERSVNTQAPMEDVVPPQAVVASAIFEDSNPNTSSNKNIEIFFNSSSPTNLPQIEKLSNIGSPKTKSGGSVLRHWSASVIMLLVVFLMVFWIGAKQGLFIKKNIIQNGQNALHNFENAKVSLENFKFNDAVANFTLAYSDLEKAAYNFGPLGAKLSQYISKVPLLNNAYTANTIIDVGLSISKSGEYLSKAMATISNIDFGSYIDPNSIKQGQRSFGSVAREFKDVLNYAKNNIDTSKQLVATIDMASLDDEKRALIEKLQTKIPLLSEYIDKAVGFADFVHGVVGERGERTYMLVFQNNTELRATGGFIGSYALLTFKDGNLTKIFVDDIYNPDGQMKEKIIPPRPMQHITPTAGTRDANWFPDFPKSAQRIIDFYHKAVGVKVDGVISITPDVFMDLLRAVGPIEMSQFNRTITADNFIAQVQDEIEYGENRVQPKTILKELQPLLLSKLKSLPKEKFADIAQNIIRRIEDKHILAYFKDEKLQKFALEHHIAGQMKAVDEGEDYISVILTNIKGSKSDAFTKTRYSLDVFEKDNLHALNISRTHNGGKEKLGFYNRQSPAYVRVYLPKNSKFISLEGNDTPAYKPLLKYDSSFVPDRDVANIEASMTHPQKEVDVWFENGKMVIGFWLIVDPQSDKSVSLKYSVDLPKLPIGSDGIGYKLLWQKQSGIKDSVIDFKYHMSAKDDFISSDKDVRVSDGIILFSAPQNQDHEIGLKVK